MVISINSQPAATIQQDGSSRRKYVETPPINLISELHCFAHSLHKCRTAVLQHDICLQQRQKNKTGSEIKTKA
jgi:hypothetical protein